MLRSALRLILLAYFIMPLVAGFLVIRTFTQIRDDITPIYETASTTISTATDALDTQVQRLGDNFKPLTTALNALQSTLQTIVDFLRNTVYTVIDVVNGLNVACSVGRHACIPKNLNVHLPTLVDLSFIDDIASNISAITGQVNTVVTTTTTTISSYTSMIVLAVAVFVGWMLLTYALFIVSLYSGLWRSTLRKARS